MKKKIIFLAALFITAVSFAQIKEPVKWAISTKKINATTYEVHLTASIDEGWHIYSQTTPEGGPVPTSITFTKNPLLTFEGKVKEQGKLEQRHEELFGVDVKQFSNKVNFVQTVKLKAAVKTSITVNVEFMSCNDNECLPPGTQKISIAIP